MQDSAKVKAAAPEISSTGFLPQSWYAATVPGTVLTTLVNNKVYPEPLYGENMREIPESLNKTSYWYRTTFNVPAEYKGRHVWLHFAGINYSAEIWVNGHKAGTMKGAFIRGDFDISQWVRKPGQECSARRAGFAAASPGHSARAQSCESAWERMVARLPSMGQLFFPRSAGTGCLQFATAIPASGFRSRWTRLAR